jgi:hypothetical protein
MRAIARLKCQFRMFAAMAVLWGSGNPVQAHRLDECLVASLVGLRPEGCDVEVDVAPGAAVAADFLKAIDANRDGKIGEEEALQFGRAVFNAVELRLDGVPVQAHLVENRTPTPEELLAGDGVLRLHGVARWRLRSGKHRLVFQNSWGFGTSQHLANALKPEGGGIAIVSQVRDEDQRRLTIEFSADGSAAFEPGGMAAGWLAAGVTGGAMIVAGLIGFRRMQRASRTGAG